MPEEITKAERSRIDAVDKAVLAEAAAARKHELSLRDSDNQRIIQIEKIRATTAADRRERIGWSLVGLAIVVVILGIVGAIWTAVDRDRQKIIRQEQVRQQTAQECIRAGNIWTSDGDCLLTKAGTGITGAAR